MISYFLISYLHISSSLHPASHPEVVFTAVTGVVTVVFKTFVVVSFVVVSFVVVSFVVVAVNIDDVSVVFSVVVGKVVFNFVVAFVISVVVFILVVGFLVVVVVVVVVLVVVVIILLKFTGVLSCSIFILAFSSSISNLSTSATFAFSPLSCTLGAEVSITDIISFFEAAFSMKNNVKFMRSFLKEIIKF